MRPRTNDQPERPEDDHEKEEVCLDYTVGNYDESFLELRGDAESVGGAVHDDADDHVGDDYVEHLGSSNAGE